MLIHFSAHTLRFSWRHRFAFQPFGFITFAFSFAAQFVIHHNTAFPRFLLACLLRSQHFLDTAYALVSFLTQPTLIYCIYFALIASHLLLFCRPRLCVCWHFSCSHASALSASHSHTASSFNFGIRFSPQLSQPSDAISLRLVDFCSTHSQHPPSHCNIFVDSFVVLKIAAAPMIEDSFPPNNIINKIAYSTISRLIGIIINIIQ